MKFIFRLSVCIDVYIRANMRLSVSISVCVCVSIILTDIDTDTDDGTSIYCHFRECSNVPRIKCFLDDGIFITPFVV